VRYSAGSGVPYLADWECNVLKPPDDMPRPPAVLRQVNAYVARRSWFADEDAEVLAERLGRISKFQSLNSEDAVTWSWFGTLGLADADARRAVTGWLFDRLGINAAPPQDVRVDQWMRVVHPNAPESPHGPELDARIDDPSVALVSSKPNGRQNLVRGRAALRALRTTRSCFDAIRCGVILTWLLIPGRSSSSVSHIPCPTSPPIRQARRLRDSSESP
jgi:hypothetical protein